MPEYYAFRKDVPLGPGEKLGFTPGRGYYAIPAPTARAKARSKPSASQPSPASQRYIPPPATDNPAPGFQPTATPNPTQPTAASGGTGQSGRKQPSALAPPSTGATPQPIQPLPATHTDPVGRTLASVGPPGLADIGPQPDDEDLFPDVLKSLKDLLEKVAVKPELRPISELLQYWTGVPFTPAQLAQALKLFNDFDPARAALRRGFALEAQEVRAIGEGEQSRLLGALSATSFIAWLVHAGGYLPGELRGSPIAFIDALLGDVQDATARATHP